MMMMTMMLTVPMTVMVVVVVFVLVVVAVLMLVVIVVVVVMKMTMRVKVMHDRLLPLSIAMWQGIATPILPSHRNLAVQRHDRCIGGTHPPALHPPPM
jgi:hypothetical protein